MVAEAVEMVVESKQQESFAESLNAVCLTIAKALVTKWDVELTPEIINSLTGVVFDVAVASGLVADPGDTLGLEDISMNDRYAFTMCMEDALTFLRTE